MLINVIEKYYNWLKTERLRYRFSEEGDICNFIKTNLSDLSAWYRLNYKFIKYISVKSIILIKC